MQIIDPLMNDKRQANEMLKSTFQMICIQIKYSNSENKIHKKIDC